MIKTNQLRIGNVIQRTSKLIHEDSGISRIDCISVGEARTLFDWYLDEELFGVELTKEVFHCIEGMAHDDDEDFQDLIHEVHTIAKLDFEFNPISKVYELRRRRIGESDLITKEKSLAYLHEIQNLYFSLTGEELIIDMDKLNNLNK